MKNILIPFVSALFLLIGMESVIYGMHSLSVGTASFWKSLYVAGFLIFVQGVLIAKVSHAKRDFLWFAVIMILSFCASGLLIFVDSVVAQQSITLIASVLLFLSMREYRNFDQGKEKLSARSVLFMAHFAGIFFFFTVSYAFHVNISIPQWFLMGAFFFFPFLISAHSFLLTQPGNARLALIYAFIMGIVFMQLAWIIHFWPFGYLTTGVIMLVMFYTLWDLFQSHLEGDIRYQRFLANILLLVVLSSIVLLSSPWEIIRG